MKTAIVILNWNGASMLRRFLPSVVDACESDCEVIVADNGSTDDSRAIVESVADKLPVPIRLIVAGAEGSISAAYNNGEDPSGALLGYVGEINNEITRKRRQFDMMVEEQWDAIKEYNGFSSFDDWREYWAAEYGTDFQTPDVIKDSEDPDAYTYVDWMAEHGVTEANFAKWQKEVKTGDTDLSYKEWLESN